MVLITLLIAFLFASPAAQDSGLYKITKKRADKVMAKYWSGEAIKLTAFAPATAQQLEVYSVSSTTEPLAYVLFAEAPSKVETFIYMIIFDLDGNIEHVSVLLYKENYGGEIASKRFLKQFSGKANGQHMKYNQDIDGISGATISVRSITHSIKQNSIAFYNLINPNQ